MAYSAKALGQADLQLRARRVRSDRSSPLSVALILLVIAPAVVIGYVGASLRALAAPVDAARTDEQRFFAALPPVDVQLQRTMERVGLSVASYQSSGGDVTRLSAELDQAIASYRDVESQLQELNPPPDLAWVQQSYLDALNVLVQSTLDLQAACRAAYTERPIVARPSSPDSAYSWECYKT